MFSSVGKEEYGKLFDFVTAKQLRVKNRADQGGPNYQVNIFVFAKDDIDENDDTHAEDVQLQNDLHH